MEQGFVISTSDDAEIYGVLHSSVEKNRPLIVLVHGLTGHMEEYIHLRLARLLNATGYPVIRFNQYGDEDRARRFHTSTIRDHVADTQEIVKYAKGEGFSKVVLAGHSLGSPVAIGAAGGEVEAVILIDPTGWPKDRIKDWETRDRDRDIAYLDWSRRILLGERWIEDAKSFPNSYEQFAGLRCPVQIVAAEKADQMPYCKRYQEAHPRHPEIEIIQNATHCFTEDGAVEALASLMVEWVARNVG